MSPAIWFSLRFPSRAEPDRNSGPAWWCSTPETAISSSRASQPSRAVPRLTFLSSTGKPQAFWHPLRPRLHKLATLEKALVRRSAWTTERIRLGGRREGHSSDVSITLKAAIRSSVLQSYRKVIHHVQRLPPFPETDEIVERAFLGLLGMAVNAQERSAQQLQSEVVSALNRGSR